jgi:hypothetical protein
MLFAVDTPVFLLIIACALSSASPSDGVKGQPTEQVIERGSEVLVSGRFFFFTALVSVVGLN